MDDNKFDHLIKDKVGEYQATEYDPTALADLHYRMASQYSIPWHVQYRNEIVVAAASVAVAIILLWGQWRIGQAENQALRSEIKLLQSERAEVKNMQDMFTKLSTAPDTVRIVQYRKADKQLYERLLAEIGALKGQLFTQESKTGPDLLSNAQLVYLGLEEDLPYDVVDALKQDGRVVRRGEHVFLLASDSILSEESPWFARRKGILTEHFLPQYQFVLDTSYAQEDIVINKMITKPIEISVKQMREMEKHYKKGIGIKLGPTLDFYNSRYSIGQTEEAWGVGMMTDLIVSPSLSIETGVSYQERVYSTDRLDDLNLPPGDDKRGEFNELEVKSRMLEVPLNLKYRYPFNHRSNFVASLGVSGLLYTHQAVEYQYEFDAGNDLILPVESSFREKDPKWYAGTFNASLGLNRQLKNKKEVEISLFYKYGLGEMGIEQVNADFIGVRGAYWFTVKK